MREIFQTRAKLLYNKQVKGQYLHCALVAHSVANKARPGQFVDIKLTDTFEPLLRRPFSIHRVGHKDILRQASFDFSRYGSGGNKIVDTIEILYEVVGQGTEILSQKKAGEFLDIIGPLGNGFNYTPHATRHTLQILVAGGMGVAPLAFLAEKLRGQATKVLIGAKTKEDILCEKEFRKLGCDVKIATEDGSRGFKGKVTALFKYLLSTIDYRLSTIYACGPRPMLKEIALLSQKYNIPAQVSLEEHMACGIGACFGCAVKTKEGYKRVCKEGPVFETGQIIWERNKNG